MYKRLSHLRKISNMELPHCYSLSGYNEKKQQKPGSTNVPFLKILNSIIAGIKTRCTQINASILD